MNYRHAFHPRSSPASFATAPTRCSAFLAGLVMMATAGACGAPAAEFEAEEVEQTTEAAQAAQDLKPIAAAAITIPSIHPTIPAETHIWVFVRGQSNKLYRRVLRRNDLTWLTAWEDMNIQVSETPAVHTYGSQGMVVYFRGMDGRLFELWYSDARNPLNPWTGPFDLFGAFGKQGTNLMFGRPTVAVNGENIMVFVHGPSGSNQTNIVFEYDAGWGMYEVPPSGSGNDNPFAAEDSLVAAVHGYTVTGGIVPRLLTRNFFSGDSDLYETQPHSTFESISMNGSPAVTSNGTEIRVWVRSGPQLKRITLAASGWGTSWTQNGTCTNVRSAPSLGAEFAQTPYFACGPTGSPGLCKQTNNSGCTALSGGLSSAPTVVPNVARDVVFYKGSNGRAWMYTTVNGHVDLNLTLP
jgi:hypothetical protein